MSNIKFNEANKLAGAHAIEALVNLIKSNGGTVPSSPNQAAQGGSSTGIYFIDESKNQQWPNNPSIPEGAIGIRKYIDKETYRMETDLQCLSDDDRISNYDQFQLNFSSDIQYIQNGKYRLLWGISQADGGQFPNDDNDYDIYVVISGEGTEKTITFQWWARVVSRALVDNPLYDPNLEEGEWYEYKRPATQEEIEGGWYDGYNEEVGYYVVSEFCNNPKQYEYHTEWQQQTRSITYDDLQTWDQEHEGDHMNINISDYIDPTADDENFNDNNDSYTWAFSDWTTEERNGFIGRHFVEVTGEDSECYDFDEEAGKVGWWTSYPDWFNVSYYHTEKHPKYDAYNWYKYDEPEEWGDGDIFYGYWGQSIFASSSYVDERVDNMWNEISQLQEALGSESDDSNSLKLNTSNWSYVHIDSFSLYKLINELEGDLEYKISNQIFLDSTPYWMNVNNSTFVVFICDFDLDATTVLQLWDNLLSNQPENGYVLAFIDGQPDDIHNQLRLVVTENDISVISYIWNDVNYVEQKHSATKNWIQNCEGNVSLQATCFGKHIETHPDNEIYGLQYSDQPLIRIAMTAQINIKDGRYGIYPSWKQNEINYGYLINSILTLQENNHNLSREVNEIKCLLRQGPEYAGFVNYE